MPEPVRGLEELTARIDAIGLEMLFDTVAAGASNEDVCRQLGCSLRLWDKWIRVQSAEIRGEYAEAIRLRADALASEARQVSRNAAPTSSGIAKAKLEVDVLKWQAQSDDPARFQPKPTVQVNTNVTTGLDEALRAVTDRIRAERDRIKAEVRQEIEAERLAAAVEIKALPAPKDTA